MKRVPRAGVRRWALLLTLVASRIAWADAGSGNDAPAGYVVDPRYPFTIEVAALTEVPFSSQQTLFPDEVAPPQGFSSATSTGVRAQFFAPFAEKLQVGGGGQTSWRLRTATDWLNTTSLFGGVRLINFEDRLRTYVDLQAMMDVGSAFALGVRGAASAGWEFAPGWYAQATLSASLVGIRLRAALGLSAGVSYAW